MNWAVYFYSLGSEKDVQCRFYELPGKKEANKYLEITFKSGTLSPNDVMYITGEFIRMIGQNSSKGTIIPTILRIPIRIGKG